MESVPPDRQFLTGLRLGGRSTADSLSNGQIVKLTVNTSGKGRIVLHGDGLTLSGRNDAHLRSGQRIVAKVELSGSLVRLRIIDTTASTPLRGNVRTTLYAQTLERLGIADTPAAREVFRSFVVSGRGLQPELFQRTIQQFRALARRDRSTARGALELSDRDIPIDPFDPDKLQEIVGWFAGGGEGKPQERREETGNGGRSGKTSANTLREFLERTTTIADHPLQLYNALRPETADLHWVVFPIRGRSAAGGVSSVLKVAWDIRQGRPVEALLSVDRENGRWWFRWLYDGSLRLVGSWSDTPGDPPPEKLLARIGGTGHNGAAIKGDGFSVGEVSEETETVDWYG